MILWRPNVVLLSCVFFFRFVITRWKIPKSNVDTFFLAGRLDFDVYVSRRWFRLFVFKCPEVGLGFSFLGVHKSDHIFDF